MGWDVDDPALLSHLAAGDTANYRPRSPVLLRRSKAGEEHKVTRLKSSNAGAAAARRRSESAVRIASAMSASSISASRSEALRAFTEAFFLALREAWR